MSMCRYSFSRGTRADLSLFRAGSSLGAEAGVWMHVAFSMMCPTAGLLPPVLPWPAQSQCAPAQEEVKQRRGWSSSFIPDGCKGNKTLGSNLESS